MIWCSWQSALAMSSSALTGLPGDASACRRWRTRQTMPLDFGVATHDRTSGPRCAVGKRSSRKTCGARSDPDDIGGGRRSIPDRHRQNPRCAGAARNLAIEFGRPRIQLAKSFHAGLLSSDHRVAAMRVWVGKEVSATKSAPTFREHRLRIQFTDRLGDARHRCCRIGHRGPN